MTSKSKEFGDAYAGPEITLPDGRTVTAKPLPLSDAAKWLRVGERADAGDPGAEAEILEKFFADVGIKEHVESFLPQEAMVTFWTFFTVNRFRNNGQPENTSPATTETAAAESVSMTS